MLVILILFRYIYQQGTFTKIVIRLNFGGWKPCLRYQALILETRNFHQFIQPVSIAHSVWEHVMNIVYEMSLYAEVAIPMLFAV